MDSPEAVKQWYYGTLLGQIQQGHENPWAHIYEVEPSEGPHPWNGSGQDGHVAPSARIVREIATDKYNRLPDHLGGKNGDLPDLKYKWYGVHPFLGDNWLEAEHKGKTIARMYWATKDHPQPGQINLVQVHPEYRRRGIATDMVNTVRDEIDPGIKFSPDVSPDGKAWSKANGYKPSDGWNNLKPRDDKSEWRTAQRFWAMADTTKWHPMIKHDGQDNRITTSRGGMYHISIPDKMNPTGRRIGDLSYTKYTKGENHYDIDDKDGRWKYMPRPHSEAYIDSLIVHPDFQGQGIAQALVERLAQDHPEHRINPGATTQSGNDFTERLRKIIPEANDRLVPNYDPVILDESDTEDYTQSELDRLVNARFWRKAGL
jgi:ribosomal protein S18 acetylase RimI-like enzyme